jgi:hypothetical protein
MSPTAKKAAIAEDAKKNCGTNEELRIEIKSLSRKAPFSLIGSKHRWENGEVYLRKDLRH